MASTTSHDKKYKGNIDLTSMPIHCEWDSHPNDSKHTSFRILWHAS
jgi:hypothetical protein